MAYVSCKPTLKAASRASSAFRDQAQSQLLSHVYIRLPIDVVYDDSQAVLTALHAMTLKMEHIAGNQRTMRMIKSIKFAKPRVTNIKPRSEPLSPNVFLCASTVEDTFFRTIAQLPNLRQLCLIGIFLTNSHITRMSGPWDQISLLNCVVSGDTTTRFSTKKLFIQILFDGTGQVSQISQWDKAIEWSPLSEFRFESRFSGDGIQSIIPQMFNIKHSLPITRLALTISNTRPHLDRLFRLLDICPKLEKISLISLPSLLPEEIGNVLRPQLPSLRHIRCDSITMAAHLANYCATGTVDTIEILPFSGLYNIRDSASLPLIITSSPNLRSFTITVRDADDIVDVFNCFAAQLPHIQSLDLRISQFSLGPTAEHDYVEYLDHVHPGLATRLDLRDQALEDELVDAIIDRYKFVAPPFTTILRGRHLLSSIIMDKIPSISKLTGERLTITNVCPNWGMRPLLELNVLSYLAQRRLSRQVQQGLKVYVGTQDKPVDLLLSSISY